MPNTATLDSKTDSKTLTTNSHQQFPSEVEEMQSQPHEHICAEFTSMLRQLFQSDENAIVGGDQGFYWNEEDDQERAAPDAYLIRNAGKSPRKSWKLWEEHVAHPAFSIEFFLEVWSDENTLLKRNRKRRRYELLGAKEFFELDFIASDLAGARLENGRYEVIEPNNDGRIYSAALNADLVFENGLLRLYRNGEKVLTSSEAAEEIVRLKKQLAENK